MLELRVPTDDDAEALAAILAEPEVARWWGRFDADRVRADLLGDDELQAWVVEVDGEVAGWVQAFEEDDPDFQQVALDVFLAARHQGRGHGREALRRVLDRFTAAGHHRFTIDPAAANERAIRAYAALGFRPVGTLRRHERAPDGTWRDGLLMELVVGAGPSAEQVMTAYLDAARAGDFATAYGFYADDLEFHIPGRGANAGTHRGKDAAIAYIEAARRKADALEVRLVDRLVSGDRVALLVEERFTVGERTVEIRRANVYTVRAGRITEVRIYEHDQYEVDELLPG